MLQGCLVDPCARRARGTRAVPPSCINWDWPACKAARSCTGMTISTHNAYPENPRHGVALSDELRQLHATHGGLFSAIQCASYAIEDDLIFGQARLQILEFGQTVFAS